MSERNHVGRVNCNGVGHPKIEEDISLRVCNEFRDDDGTSFVIFQAVSPPASLEFTLSTHQARAVAALLLDAVGDIEQMRKYSITG